MPNIPSALIGLGSAMMIEELPRRVAVTTLLGFSVVGLRRCRPTRRRAGSGYMDTGADAPPDDHPLAAGEDAAADLFAEPLLWQGGKGPEARVFRHSFLPNQDRL